MAFYLKYRPQKIDDLDLVAVRESLNRIVSSKSIPHAFLFAGPKGTGKTSAARIMAKIVNCTSKGKKRPCNKCEQCVSITNRSNIDVIELDAASHRGIDDIRVLKDAVKLAPANSSQKVYIIDEAHMLTTEASNALLKTLEEPPGHVIFILATTNPEKLIPTIRSRTTQIKFNKATVDELISSLKKKVKGEKLKAEKDVLEIIAKAADGSFRDADKILEHLSMGRKILKSKNTKEYLAGAESFDAYDFVSLLVDKDTKSALSLLAQAIGSGATTEKIIDTTIDLLRSQILKNVGFDKGVENDLSLETRVAIDLVKLLTNAKRDLGFTFLEQIPLEIAIVEWGEGGSTGNGRNENQEKEKDEVKEVKKSGGVNNHKTAVNNENVEQKNLSNDVWSQILSKIRSLNASTEALLRASHPMEMNEGTLRLGVYYKFHKEHLESNSHKMLLEDVLSDILGDKILVECFLTDPPSKEVVNRRVQDSNSDLSSETVLVEPEATSRTLTDEGEKDIIRIAEEIFSE